MRQRVVIRKSRPALAIALACLLPLACSDAGSETDGTADDPTGTTPAPTNDGVTGDDPVATTSEPEDVAVIAESGHAVTIAAIADLLPSDTRGVLAIDLGVLLSSESSAEIIALLNGQGTDPAINELFGAVGTLTGTVDVAGAMTTAVLAQTTDATDGLFVLASLRSETLDDVLAGPAPASDGTYGPASRALFLDDHGNRLTLLPGGVLVVGTASAVESVIDVADGAEPADTPEIEPFLGALSGDSHVSFVYGLPALFADVIPDRSLRGAAVMSGAFDLADGQIAGEVAFHTSNAAEFVAAYNTLDRHATQGEDPTEVPLTLAEPVAGDLDQVVVTLPPSPIDPSPDEAVAARNLFKKLFVGMEAYDYAEDVADPGNAVWVDLLVKSEADDDTPPSPGSVFIRWEFRDEAAIEAFEANELPAGFSLAPTRFLETDDLEGEYFLALNLYNSGGGSIVTGARAEWDVFVHPPEGADPDAGQRPRFLIVDALAQAVSADPVNLVTPAEPLSHALVDGVVVSSVRRFEGDSEVPVIDLSFPRPDPAEAEVARFTREMAIGNDYIYWGHGVHDRALYNATTFNHDAYVVDATQIAYTDDSRWAQYLKPAVKDAVYYVNTLEYVASPLANLDSDHLDITPEWLSELYGFKNNGHQSGIMRKSVEQLFRGENDALVGFRVANETPSTYYHFEVTDPDALSAALDLPPGHRLAPTTLFEGDDEGHYLTLSVYEIDDAIEGTRAEWSVYTDVGDGRPPNMMVVDLMTEEVGIDPVSIINVPSDVRHDLTDGVLSTGLASSLITFEASFETAGAATQALSLDWVEAGDVVCYLNGICDKLYYDAETLDVPVQRPVEVTVDTFSTPWDDVVDETPAAVFYRDNAQEYVAKRWHNLDVVVEELPFSGLDGRTHVVSGSGTLVGRDSDVADSVYTYAGDAVLVGDQVNFALDQQVDNVLGVGNIFTTGSFDLTSGTGTQTVVDCLGPALLCSDIEIGSTTFYTAQELDATDPDAIVWQVDVVLDLGGSFGTADSRSTFLATGVE